MRIEYIQCCAKNELGHTKLNSVDLTLRTGSFNVVSGDDRSGKNFLLYLVYGIVRCSDGAVMVDNKDLALFNKRSFPSFFYNPKKKLVFVLFWPLCF